MLKHCWLSGVFAFFCMASIAVQSAEPPKTADVRVLVDISGSMKETDPANLRIPATNLLVELMPNGSQGSIWTFGRYVNPLVPIASVTNAWRTNAKEKAKLINSAGLFTNLVGALDQARSNMKPNSGFDYSVILLTDGRIDMRESSMPENTDAQEYVRLFDNVIPEYIKAGAKVHTVALSDAADKELLEQIANKTGGLFLEARTADDLLKIFLKAFDRSVPGEQVPLTDNRFAIDSSVKEFTALIFRASGSKKPVQLITPDGLILTAESSGELTPVRWHQDLNFDVVTVMAPQPGEWNVDADIDPNNRVQILSDLNLSVNGIPKTLIAGSPIKMTASIVNEGKIVTNKNLLALTDIALEVTAPDGRVGRKVISNSEVIPDSGVVSEEINRLTEPGEYRFEVTATSKTFERQRVIAAQLITPIHFDSNSIAEDEELLINANHAKQVDVQKTTAVAHVTYPDGSSTIVDVAYETEGSHWELRLSPSKGMGKYVVEMQVTGVTQDGVPFTVESDDYTATFPLKPIVVEGLEPAITPEPEASAPSIVPDLQKQFEEQESAKSEPEPEKPEEPVSDEKTASSWWLYTIIAVLLGLGLGGAGFFWMNRNKDSNSTPLAADMKREQPAATPAKTIPEDLIREDIKPPVLDVDENDDFNEFDELGDFNDYSAEFEEEIPIPMPEEIAVDADMPVSLPDEFAIDPETILSEAEASDKDMLFDDFSDDFDTSLDDLDEPKR